MVEGGEPFQKRLTQKSERVEMKRSVIFLLQKRTAAKKVLTNFAGLLRTNFLLAFAFGEVPFTWILYFKGKTTSAKRYLLLEGAT